MESKKENKSFGVILVLVLTIGILGFFMPISIFTLAKNFGGTSLTENETLIAFIQGLGPVGDFMAGTTVPFLTFSGFILILVTTLMQKKELDLTRKELIETQKIIKEQSTTMILERFENTFFQMISLHNEITKSMNITKEVLEIKGLKLVKFSGRECFQEYKEELYMYFRSSMDQYYGNNRSGLHQMYTEVRVNYKSFFDNHKQELGHYFRNLYRIIKFIDEYTDLTPKQKSDYVDILRAQLSTDEITLIMYNCLSEYGEKFYNYIEKYELIDDLDSEYVHHGLVIDLFKNYRDILVYNEQLNEPVLT